MTSRFVRNFALALVVGAAAGCVATVYDPGEPPPPPPEPPPAVEPAPPPPAEDDAVFFYDSLAPYGSWVVVASYGRVWVPRVTPWWRPYTEGRWVFTEAGWTWVSTEPWGWAAYHYGRWYWDAEYGWAWVPGTVWGPAWVAWRSGEGHIGWAPLPPSVRWEAGIGFSNGGVGFRAVIAPEHWCFVEERYITAPAIREYVAPRARNVTFVNVTNNITNYTVIDNRIVNNSVDVHHVERVTSQPVPRYHVEEHEAEGAHGQGQPVGAKGTVRRVEVTPLTPVASGTPSGGTPSRAGGTVQPVHTQAGAPQPSRTSATTVTPATAASRVETPEDLRHRHDLEERQLRTKQDNDRIRLQQIQKSEVSQKTPTVTTEQLKARQTAEQQALEAEHQREAQILTKRHERELAATGKANANVKPTPKPTPKPTRKVESDKSQP